MSHRMRIALTWLLLSAGLSAPAVLQAQALFINDATVHTLGPQGTLQNADVLVRDGLIKAVGMQLPMPADATVIEAEGRPLTPGFFAGITQLGLVEITLEEAQLDKAPILGGARPEWDVSRAYNPRSAAVPITRIEGYTWTVLGASRAGSVIGGQGRAVALDDGYASFLGKPLLFVDIGADASAQSAGSRATQWMLLEQAMNEATAQDTQWTPSALLTPAGRNALEPFRSGGITVFDVDRASDILQVLEFSARHSLRPVINGGAEAWMLADRLAEAGVPVLINSLENLPGNFDQLGARLDSAAILHAAGVTIAFGGDETHNARKLRQLAGNAVANGLPYEAGLAAMTLNPVLIFELGVDTGTIAGGSRADLVLWSDDPLEVTAAAEHVVIGGRLIPMVSRQTKLRDRYLQQNPGLPRAYIKP